MRVFFGSQRQHLLNLKIAYSSLVRQINKFETAGYAVVIMIVGFLAIASTGLLINDKSTLNGTIQALNVEVYKNHNATQNCTQINFGDLSPGAVSNQTVYIKNSGTKSASLSMNVEDWNPIQAGSSLVLSWNRKDHVLLPGELINATFALDADESVEGFSDFSFNIIIVSTQIEEL